MDQTRPRAGQETRCPEFGVYASCPKLFLGCLVGPYAYVYGSCPCRQNQRQMSPIDCRGTTDRDKGGRGGDPGRTEETRGLIYKACVFDVEKWLAPRQGLSRHTHYFLSDNCRFEEI
ncbi:hypothetical protein DPX16_1408 [Anabarilius grahami]|uniref:Uncharacterized protein n=1 Tax=Anabarilius grahami TaxID=495550 RepID=A0A3N0XDT3_ANAGA|nr:hypothetical protein DPX16_1408 [Anabarilius grahami]